MSFSEALLPEFDHEMANTRRMLERVPQDKFSWKPHDKSMDVQGLMSHISNVPMWTVSTLEEDSFETNPKDGEPFKIEPVESVSAALEAFDENVKNARTALANAEDSVFMKPWSLLNGGEVIFSMPKVAVLRGFIMNHIIHHRAQLGLYLRMNDVSVPSMYGPTADEAN